MPKTYRNGPVGALMDEYERAAGELKAIVGSTSQTNFVKIVDPDTSDPDCRSIQTIMNHVVRAGYGYANYIRKQFGDDWIERKVDYGLNSPEVACKELDLMLTYTIQTLENKWDLSFEDIVNNRMKTSWGQDYDFEQLMEHAIVHILRHRRQIERFLNKILFTT
ncbi:MAG: DinB family protein [Saprospiraceae bacterium]